MHGSNGDDQVDSELTITEQLAAAFAARREHSEKVRLPIMLHLDFDSWLRPSGQAPC